MSAEPRRWTAGEVRAALGAHERGIRGSDLSGLDLRSADLQGAVFREANLRGARFKGYQLGSMSRY